MLATDKRSSSIGIFVGDKENSFITLTSRVGFKNFFFFVIWPKGFPWQDFSGWSTV
jgi:hypothetical protein